MSKGWAAIVYGRTYHLDFRFITVPHDFTAEDLNWASQHIVATTQQARKLASSPRWSLFKNQHYGVIGVTCMVKDLIGDTVKDDQGRPLYVFVGYVTQLATDQQIDNLPPYSSSCLDNFKILYQEVEKVWLIKNFEQDSRHPSPSQYYGINFLNSAIALPPHEIPQLNHYSRHPDQIYLWSNSPSQNSLLWQASAQFLVPTATCLNIQGKALINSPFLNQSSNQTEQFQILVRKIIQVTHCTSNTSANTQSNISLSQKISHRAKEDLDLTLHQATKMAIASQELINHLSDCNQSDETDSEKLDPTTNEPEFGFKVKKSPTPEQDWF